MFFAEFQGVRKFREAGIYTGPRDNPAGTIAVAFLIGGRTSSVARGFGSDAWIGVD